jgi:hypothetical protein
MGEIIENSLSLLNYSPEMHKFKDNCSPLKLNVLPSDIPYVGLIVSTQGRMRYCM